MTSDENFDCAFESGMSTLIRGVNFGARVICVQVRAPVVSVDRVWRISGLETGHPGLDGQEVSLKLHHYGHIGSFEDSSGKSYEVVSCRAQDPDAVVFLSSQSEPKIDGKISRRVSLIHYPEPSELKQNSINLKQMMAQRSSGTTTLTNSSRRFATPSQSTRTRSIMRSGSSSKSTIRKHSDGQSVQDSGKSGRSVLTSSGSFDHSRDKKSKKKRKTDG
ncbi:mediator-associated protein 2-like [Solanum pennellii]|uniref:Mediator-associated protein 2-like n=1 Tax=Solanum pennellii TaxID=28526 RepID=A0ABM1V277_SOLPN|nr:mediator-associated protein 2-like [Solanum pennellii]